MRVPHPILLCGLVAWMLSAGSVPIGAQLVFETTTPHHHLRVVDEFGIRTLYFDNEMQTQMSLDNPLRGHFEYTEFFHLAWLWNDRIQSVLMIGLGGGSAPRAFQHYYTNVLVEVVELDSQVVRVAREFFGVEESPRLKITVSDGRMHLRRTRNKYDLIILDAYSANRYGAAIPAALTTREFFALASDHLTTNGVLAYNVIGRTHARGAGNIVGAISQTLSVVFPQVHHFPAPQSGNVVLLASKSSRPSTLPELSAKAAELVEKKRVTFPNFRMRVSSFRAGLPPAAKGAKVLTDDFAPVEGMLEVGP